MKTLAIIGAGRGLGMAIAKKFGQHGFQVALVARNKEKLNQLVAELTQAGIKAAAFQADILKNVELDSAFTAIKEKYGVVDVLEYSPISGIDAVAGSLNLTEEDTLYQFRLNVLGAITSVRQVLPEMLKNQSGALLFTTGASAIHPVSMMGNVGIAMAGLRNYVLNLNNELKDKGIYAGHLSIGIWMKPNSGVQNKIADIWYDMYTKRNRAEELITEEKI
jgi:short-subunit dehydrogenase